MRRGGQWLKEPGSRLHHISGSLFSSCLLRSVLPLRLHTAMWHSCPGEVARGGGRLVGRHPREDAQLQARCADGDASPGVSWVESGGLAACPGPPPQAGWVGWVLAAQLAHSGGKASLLQDETASPPRPPAAVPGGPGTVLPSGTLRREPGLQKAKNWHKDHGIKKKKKKRKEAKFWDFSYFISSS